MEQDRDALIENESSEPVQSDVEPGPGCCSRHGVCYRYMALFHMCVIGFGSCFCFDNPGALQDVIINDISLSTTQFSYIYSIYSWPNVILCFIGGFLIDRVFGIRLGTVLYTAIVVIGQLVFALGGFLESYWIIMLGRLIFGIGGESLAVAQNYYAVQWFRGKELNMVFGLQMALSRIGSAVNFLVMGPIYSWVLTFVPEYEALGVALLIASSTCVASLISAILLAFMSMSTAPRNGDQNEDSRAADTSSSDKDVAKLTDILEFLPSFWLICVICIAFYIAIFPFVALSKIFLMRKYNFTPEDANGVTSLVYIVSAVASPIFGIIIDKIGRNVSCVVGSIFVSMLAHGALAFTTYNPIPIVAVLGLAYSLLASALWPMIALITPDYQLGSAFGVAQALQNTGLAGATLISGLIVDQFGYFRLEIFFILSLTVALGAGFLIWIYDLRTTGILNMTIPQRQLHEQFEVARRIQGDAEDDVEGGSEGPGTSRRPFPYIQTINTSPWSVNAVAVSRPRSSFNIRTRYIARLAGSSASNVPDHLESRSHQYMYRNLR